MLTAKELNETLESLELYSRDLELLNRKSRDLVFIAVILSIMSIVSVIVFNEFIAVSWAFTNILLIYVCVKIWKYHAEEKRTHRKIRKKVQKLLTDGELSERSNKKVKQLYHLGESFS